MTQFTKIRWVLSVAGLLMYVADICTDAALAYKYAKEERYAFAALTLLFVAVGLLVTQVFSSAWYRDDITHGLIKAEGGTTSPGVSKCGLVALHLLGVGIFIRYYHLLKQGFWVVWRATDRPAEESRQQHHSLFCLAADLSMLRLMEAFLESVPQLLLQLYVRLGPQECSLFQGLGMAFSFLNAAWALVDYQRCLRRSLPHLQEMPSGLPTLIYLLYKLSTITSHILGYALLLVLSVYSAVGLAVLWLLGTVWANCLRTDFCSSRGLEFLYRAVVGVILTFTFFNVKGQGTKYAMIAYYVFHSFINWLSLVLLHILRPDLLMPRVLLCISLLIAVGSLTGPLCLWFYYQRLHPSRPCREADEVDGVGIKAESKIRLKDFLHP